MLCGMKGGCFRVPKWYVSLILVKTSEDYVLGDGYKTYEESLNYKWSIGWLGVIY